MAWLGQCQWTWRWRECFDRDIFRQRSWHGVGRVGESGGCREGEARQTSDPGRKNWGPLGEGRGARSQEQGFAASGHIWCLPRLTARVHLVLGRRKRALMRGSCGRAAGSHLFCFQHQRPEKRVSSPEGHGHPSWRLHCQEARSWWPVPACWVQRTPLPPPPHDFLATALETSPPLTLTPTPGLAHPCLRRSIT